MFFLEGYNIHTSERYPYTVCSYRTSVLVINWRDILYHIPLQPSFLIHKSVSLREINIIIIIIIDGQYIRTLSIHRMMIHTSELRCMDTFLRCIHVYTLPVFPEKIEYTKLKNKTPTHKNKVIDK